MSADYLTLTRAQSSDITEQYLRHIGTSTNELKSLLDNCGAMRESLKITPYIPHPSPTKPKVVFLLGSAGSGKSHILKTLLPASERSFPMYLYNPDQYVETVLGMLQLTPDNIDHLKTVILPSILPSTVKDLSRRDVYLSKWKSGMLNWFIGKAKACSFEDFNRMVNARASFVIDRPGDSLQRKTRSPHTHFTKDASVFEQMMYLEEKGYDISIVINYADRDTCVARNKQRERSLSSHIVKNIWHGVYDLIQKYKDLAEDPNKKHHWNFMIYDNRDEHYVCPDPAVSAAYPAPSDMVKGDAARALLKQWLSK